jgi:hypothetical protein
LHPRSSALVCKDLGLHSIQASPSVPANAKVKISNRAINKQQSNKV